MGVFKVNYNNLEKKFSANLRLRYRSKYGLFDSNSNNYLDKYDTFVKGHFTTNISLNKKINSKTMDIRQIYFSEFKCVHLSLKGFQSKIEIQQDLLKH